MGYKRVTILITFIISLAGCAEEKSDLTAALKEHGFLHHLPKDSEPVKLIVLKSKEKTTMTIPMAKKMEVGVVLKKGFELSKKYSAENPVLEVRNRNCLDENFSTSYSAWRDFTLNKKSEAELIFKNTSSEEITFVVYKKK